MSEKDELREAEILERCLRRLEEGADLEACLREFPEAASMRPLLQTALWLRKGQEVSLHPSARQRMIRQGQRHASRARARPAVPHLAGRWAGALAALLVLILVALGVVRAAEASLPDEPLYPVKRAAEGVFAAVMPPGERALWLAERRWGEFERAVAQGRWLPALAEESLRHLEEAALSGPEGSASERARIRALYERQGAILARALQEAPPEVRPELARVRREWAQQAARFGSPEAAPPPTSEATPSPISTAEILRERTPPGLERRGTPPSERTPPGLERRETPQPARTPPGLEKKETPRPAPTPPGQGQKPTPSSPESPQDQGSKGPPGGGPPGGRK